MNDLHVVPTWQEHDASPNCWCVPLKDDPKSVFLVDHVLVHRLANDGERLIDPAKDPGPLLGGWQIVEALS